MGPSVLEGDPVNSDSSYSKTLPFCERNSMAVSYGVTCYCIRKPLQHHLLELPDQAVILCEAG